MSTYMYFPLVLIDSAITSAVGTDRKVIVPLISRAIHHLHPTTPLRRCAYRVGEMVTRYNVPPAPSHDWKRLGHLLTIYDSMYRDEEEQLVL